MFYFRKHNFICIIHWSVFNTNACHIFIFTHWSRVMHICLSKQTSFYFPHFRGRVYNAFTPMSVRPSVRPSVCRQGFPELFEKTILAQFISYLAFTLMGWVSWPLYIFVFLASFAALWWPNVWPKMGFPNVFDKTIGSIQCFSEEFPPV